MVRKRGTHFYTILAAALTVVLSGCGGSSSSSSGTTPTTDVPPAVAGTTVTGQVVKGVISGGLVSAFGVTGGLIDTTALATAITNANGVYSLNFPEYTGPLFITVSAAPDGSTMMRCDVPAGCFDGTTATAFGDFFALPTGFSLRGAVPSASSMMQVNVSVFSNLAAQLAEDSLMDVTNAGLSAAIANANSQVAQILELNSNSLTDLPLVDITSNAVGTLSADAQRLAALNAGALSSLLGFDNDLNGAIAALTMQFSANGGQLVINDIGATDAATISLNDILSDAAAVIGALPDGGVDLSDILADISADVLVTEQAEPGITTDGMPSPTAGANRLDAAKAFVTDLRAITTALDDPEIAAEDVQAKIDAALEIGDDSVTDALDALGQAIFAAGDAVNEFEDDATLTSFTSDDIVVMLGVADAESDLTSFAIDQTIDGVAVVLSGTAATMKTETEDESGESSTVDVMTDFSGSATGEGATITLGASSGSVALLETETMSVEETMGGPSTQITRAEALLESFALDLDVTIEQTITGDDVDPITFDGALSFSATGVSMVEIDAVGDLSECPGTASGCFSEEETEELSFDDLAITLAGTLETQSGLMQTISLGITADGRDVVFQSIDEVIQGIDSADAPVFFEFSDDSGETDDAFVGIDFSVSITSPLVGLSDSTTVELNGNRTGRNTGVITLTVAYEGRMFTATIPRTADEMGNLSTTINIVNQDSVMLDAVLGEDGDEVQSGTITVDGEVQGTIEERDGGLIVVTFIDETFESIN